MKGLTFEADKHLFRYNGKEVPSVTQILGDLGFIKNREWMSEESRTRGEYVHHATALLDQGILDWYTVDERISGYIKAYEKFKQEHEARVVRIEMPVYSTSFRYAGIVDRVMDIGYGREVIDLKTGGPSDWHKLQVAAYALASKLPNCSILYLRSSGDYRLLQLADWKQDLEDWKCAVRTYYRKWKRHG